jgi:hypothetical protein
MNRMHKEFWFEFHRRKMKKLHQQYYCFTFYKLWTRDAGIPSLDYVREYRRRIHRCAHSGGCFF